MARIYDNIDLKFTQGLQGIITNAGVKRVDFCVGYFNLRGWNLVINQVDQLRGDYIFEKDERAFRVCRLLIGMHRPPEELVKRFYGQNKKLPDAEFVQQCKTEIAIDFKRQLLLGLPTKQDELTLRRLSQQMKDGKVSVKLYLREPLHAKLYLAHRPDDNFNKIQAIMGSSNLTYAGLTGNGELNAEFADSDSAEKLSKWFDARWEDRFCVDITEELINVIEHSWACVEDIPPYYIYLKTAYHLSQEARSGIKEFTLPQEFKRELFDFQENAVKIAAKHLANDKRGGAMIGDVVGLGKTITACAIAKMWEMTYASSTLIICPANLQEMWHKYVKKYDLKADVMSMAKPIDVDNARYYRLIIVDESHNLRNSQGQRYHNIKELIQRQDSKVLLLTATPYNKDFSDLGSQLRLFIGEDVDLGIRPENYIRELGGERAFMQQHSETPIRSIGAFEKSYSTEDWSELMKLFLVRRTRTFIKNNFAKVDESNGRRYLQFSNGQKSYFPDRKPHSIKYPVEKGDQLSKLYSAEMIELMGKLNLPRYGLNNYISDNRAEEAQKHEQQIIENLSRAGARMMGFCKSTLFKRMDSSGYSFLVTLYRHLMRNMLFVYAIENKLPLPIGDENAMPTDLPEDNDVSNIVLSGDEQENIACMKLIPTNLDVYKSLAEKYYSGIAGKNNISWIESKYFKKTLKQQLLADCKTIIEMIELCGQWNPVKDRKLDELEKLLNGKHKSDKVIVFTQYSDTAQYIYEQLQARGVNHVDIATGNSKNPTAAAERFSPVSNGVDVPKNEQTRVLIATDVLSEGQNLQDAHVIVNFDLPWAIIRLIQRAGRVDRIGQTSEKIDCYSFFPADGIEEIIKLRERLNDRINANAEIVGSDEIFFDGNKNNLRDMYNEKSGVLDDDDDNDVDLGSYAYQIWKNATDANPELARIIPHLSNVIYSTKATDNAMEEGVITYARTYNDFDVLVWLDKDGNEISRSQKRILQALACNAKEPCQPALENHHDLVSTAIGTISQEVAPTIGGILGNRFSTRFRIIQLLEHYYEQPATIFFDNEKKQMLKLAIDDIYNFPLLENAKFMLGRLLRTASQDVVIDSVLEMRASGNLCRIEEDKVISKDPAIICSMGITKV